MKRKNKFFWQVDEFNLEGKHHVPRKLLENGSYEVLFPHHYFQHDLRRYFGEKIDTRNSEGDIFEIFFNQNGKLINSLDENKFRDYESISGFKTKWKKKVGWYNEVLVRPTGLKEDLDFEDEHKINKFFNEDKRCCYCGVETIFQIGLVGPGLDLNLLNESLGTDYKTKKKMKEHLKVQLDSFPLKAARFDHIYEKALGGNNKLSNMSLLCNDCHKMKTDLLSCVRGKPEQYGFFINNKFIEEAPEITHHMMLKKFEKDYDRDIIELKINQY